MNMQQTCDPDRLDAFVRGELSEQQESELTAHLDQCAACGEELERRVAEADQWREAGELLTHRTRRSNVVDHANGPSTSGGFTASTTFAEQMDLVVGMLAPTDDPEMLGRIGGYEVSGVIGCGGMGVVFKAHDRSLDRVVAIKVMAPHLAGSGAARKRFARESKAAAAVLHPNVIAIHCVADDPTLPYLVMPYIGGTSLQKRVEADGPLCTQDTLRIGQQIAAGLAAAHAQGLVHRDIKPANILLERGVERVTITDFGLARAVDDATMTRSGVIAGTPQYMSPEQARGESIDHRSDLFSLGSVLYMMCAGHSPFRAETTFGILRRITDNPPRPIREINPEVPEWLCAIIEKLHAKEPSERFQSAEEVAQLLESCLAHVQQPATTPLPNGVQALASQSVSASTESIQANRLKARHQRIPPIGKYIAAAAGAAALFFAGILIVLELGKGTLTIESELDDVPIRIMQGDKVVEKMTVSRTGNSVRVAAGMYVVELDAKLDGIVVENESISLKRGDSEQIRIRYAKPLANSSEGSTPDKFSQSLQGEWDYVSVETDGVTTEYKTLDVQQRTPRLKVAGDRWTVPLEDGVTVFGSGHRVEIDGNKLTFHGMTTMPGLSSNEEIPTIGYGLFEVDGDELTYLMTPAVAERAQNGQGQPLIKFPDSFDTKGTENTVYRLRRIQASTPPIPGSSTYQTLAKSSPEFPPVKIVVHDKEGRPREGVKVSLYRVAKDQGGPVLEINEISTANGLAVNRSLPYGHYDLSARTSDGWVLHHGSRLNVEFEKGLDVVLVAPTANKTAKLVINSDLGPPSAAVNELRFGELQEVNGRGYSGTYAPEPVAKPMDGEKETKKEGASTKRASPVNGESYDSFPSIVNGIEYVGVEIDTEITRSIPQAAPSLKHIHTTWEWWPTESDDFKRRYLVANNQARGLMDEKDLHLSPVDASQFFKLPGPSYRVGASRLELGEPTALPLELEIPAGDVKVYIGRFYGKPNAAALAALNWRQQEKKSELWLEALILRESAWIERLMKTTDWVYSASGEGSYILSGHLLRREVSLKPGETLDVSLCPKYPNPMTHRASEARTLDDITSIYNEQTRQLRTELFTPPIPDLTTAQMREAMLDAAEQYRKQGRVEVSSALKTSAETNRLADRLTFMGLTGTLSSDGFRQIAPTFNWEAASHSALMVVLGKAELRYSRDGWSSKAWGDIHPPITGKWELVSVEQRGETLTQTAYDPWRKSHNDWTELTIEATSLTMAGDNPAKFDFSVDYDTGLLPQYTIRQNGNTKYSGVLMGNGFIDDNKLVIAVDLEGRSTPQTFHTTDGKTTNLTYRRMPAKPQTEFAIAAANNDTSLNPDLKRLQGEWRLAHVFQHPTLTSDSNCVFGESSIIVGHKADQPPHKYVYTLRGPSEIDLRPSIPDGLGAPQLGRYLIKDNRLTIVFNQDPNTKERPVYATMEDPSKGVTLLILERVESAETAAMPSPSVASESKAPAFDHRNARSVVEAYVASTLSGDVSKAASLAKNSPADPKHIRELPEFLNVQRLKIETVYINDPAKPTQALATSVAVKLGEEHKNPDGRRDGFMVFTLELTDEKWFVIDIDFETESGAEKELSEFLKANPNSIGIPPQS